MTLKKVLIACAAMFSMVAMAQTRYAYQSVDGDITGSRIYTLKNGLKVYLSVNKEQPRIQTYIAVRTGSRNDPAETTGLAHYLEHLMFKGTKQFGTTDYAAERPLLDTIEARFEQYRHVADPVRRKTLYHEIDSISQLAARYNIPNEYDKLMASIGAEGSNAYTSNDVTCYTEDIPANEVENWARIEADRFQNMVIRGFHTELEAVYEEYNIGLAKDIEKEWTAFNAKMFPTHPYGTQTTIGTQEHLKNPSIVNIKNYFNRYYVPNNVAICMAGDLDPDQVIATIDKYFGAWKRSDNLSYPTYAPLAEATAVADTTVVGQESENIMMGWRFDGASSLQNDTLDIIAEVLSNGTAGLFDLNLNQAMKCQAAQAFKEALNEYSAFMLYGMPKEGQTLDEVKDLMLAEVEKLKHGEFSDDLLPSVISNLKLNYYTSMENNQSRASAFVDAFINGQEWKDVVGYLDRIARISKQDIMDFAKKYFVNNYVAVYKRMGEDTTQKKIDKPEITGIPTNRDLQSDFVTEIANAHVAPIQPRFVDFSRDMQQSVTKKKLPVLYVNNATNGLFTLAYKFDFGETANKWLSYAADYIDYLGTDKLTATQLKQQFYKLACKMSISVKEDITALTLSGLNENLASAVSLMEDFLANAKPDQQAYDDYVASQEKWRADDKLSQRTNFSRLYNYCIYGEYNTALNVPTIAELKARNPQDLIDMISQLTSHEHTLLYYGPTPLKDLCVLMDKHHKVPRRLLPAPESKPYMEQPTPQTEIFIAPYDAKNIYMVQYHNEGTKWDISHEPVVNLFDEYFGGGMNTIVFQELRESRGLAYSAWAQYNTPSRKAHPEWAMTQIISQNDKMMDCIRTFNSILDTIPQSEKAFALAKQSLTKQLATSRTTKFGIINAYLSAQRLGLSRSIGETVYNALPSLTLKDIAEFGQQRLAHKPFRYFILGDEKSLDMKSLEKIGPVHRLSTEQIFGY